MTGNLLFTVFSLKQLFLLFSSCSFSCEDAENKQKVHKNSGSRETEGLKIDEVKRFPSITRDSSFIMPMFVYLDYSVAGAATVRLIAVAWWSVI